VVDLVVNHTSDQHPWFQEARRSRDSRYRDWYVWVDEPPEGLELEEVFPGEQNGTWAYDEEAGQYYLHRFYEHQPDLNITNKDVREEIARIIGFWLSVGVAGFRVDAVPFLLETQAIPNAGGGPDPHQYLRELRAFLGRRRGDAILLGEVNLPPTEQRPFFGDEDGDELHLIFQFSVMQRIYLAMARQDARPLELAVSQLPTCPFDSQWATFLRNHDELTLDQLTEAERQDVFDAFGPDPDMQLYDRGLRRRLPTMLGGDEARIRLAYSLLFSMPGTPVLFYGEEIGMGENLDVPGRAAVRTPMQWSPEPGAGFSTADEKAFPTPLVAGEYGHEHVNVADQRVDPDSLLNWFERLIRRRRETHELSLGGIAVIPTEPVAVFAHRCDWDGETIVAVHNLSPERLDVSVPIDHEDDDDVEEAYDLFDGDRLPVRNRRFELDLDGYGYGWFRLHRTGRRMAP
jgi:maltose alpha-D-glucosyltransferase/alpha-amylase